MKCVSYSGTRSAFTPNPWLPADSLLLPGSHDSGTILAGPHDVTGIISRRDVIRAILEPEFIVCGGL
jgi:hypothetical protein